MGLVDFRGDATLGHRTFPNNLLIVLEMIKFEHTIFALPFAFAGAWLASGGVPSVFHMIWITAAMVSARSAAMALNRLIDRHIDARNPRTSNRALPMGLVGVGFTRMFTLVSICLFVISAKVLGPICLWLSPAALGILIGYSYTKRFTWACHLWLGTALSIAPTGAWLAIRGEWATLPLFISAGVILWTAGFDIIYACLDVDFDRREKLFSIPSRWGIPQGLMISRFFYIGAVCFFTLAGLAGGLSFPYYAGLSIAVGLLIYEHIVITPTNLARVNLAFSTMNGLVSTLIFLGIVIDLALKA